MRKWLEAWGAYLLAGLCACVILFSAVWTRNTQQMAAPDAQALSDQSQRLSEVTPAPTDAPRFFPCTGEILRPFSLSPVFFSDTGLWMIHRAVDYQAAEGESVAAMMDGTARVTRDGLSLQCGGTEILYRGLMKITVQDGQSVRAGHEIGLAGGWVPFEGKCVCVAMTQNGEAMAFCQQ